MAKLILQSKDSFVIFGKQGSALTENDSGVLFPLTQKVSVSVDVAGARQTSKTLGSNFYSVNEIIKQPEVSVDLSYYLSPYGGNEKICGITGSGSGAVNDFLQAIKDRHNNIYIAFNNKEPQEGFSEPRDRVDNDWNSYSFLSVGNCYLKKYSLNFSLNNPAMASMSFVGGNLVGSFVSDGEILVPSRLYNGDAPNYFLPLDMMYSGLDSGIAIRDEMRTLYNPSVALPYKTTVELSELQCGGISISTGYNPIIQNMSFDVDLDRTPYYGLGSNYPMTRKTSWPLNGSLNIDFLISGIRQGDLQNLTEGETGHYIKFNCGDLHDTGLFLTYEIPKARLQSASYSCDVNDIYRCQMQFMFDNFKYLAYESPDDAPFISGEAYPQNTLTSNVTGQWYVNNSPVSGETGSSYIIGLNDIGYEIKQSGISEVSNTLTCWSPVDITGVAAFWTPYRNVYSSTAPLTAATSGSPVVRWNDIKNGIKLDSYVTNPTYRTTGQYPFLLFSGASAGMDFDTSGRSVFQNKTYGEIFFCGKITSNGTSSVCSPVHFGNGSFILYPRLAISSKVGGSAGAYTRANRQDTSTVIATSSHSSILNTEVVLNSRAEWFTGGLIYINVDNGTPVTTALGVTANSPNTASILASIGRPHDLTNNQANGEYRCVCLVDGQLTNTERSQIARYMGLHVGKNIPLV